MRRLLLLLCGVLLPGLAFGAIAQVQASHLAVASNQPSIALTYGSIPSVGNLLVAYCAVFQVSFSTAAPVFSDNRGNAWSVAINEGTDDNNSTRARLYSAWAVAGVAASTTVTCDPPVD